MYIKTKSTGIMNRGRRKRIRISDVREQWDKGHITMVKLKNRRREIIKKGIKTRMSH